METRETIAKKRAERRRRRFYNVTLPRILFGLAILVVVAVLIACTTASVTGGDTDAAQSAKASEETTSTPGTKSEPEKPAAFYELTAEERELIEWTLSAECRGEPYDGQLAVAQCLLNACLKDNIRPAEAIVNYKYTKDRVKPTESIKRAVAAIFDAGDLFTEEPILYFYNPDIGDGSFHETQEFVMTIKHHKFFKEVNDK